MNDEEKKLLKEWLIKIGMPDENPEDLLEYKEGQLLEAAKRLDSISDWDDWQELQTMLEQELSLDLSLKISNLLYENDIEVRELKHTPIVPHKFYYTFGSASYYPYCYGYVVVEAKNKTEANEKFRKKHPDRNEGILNCAFVYTEEGWSHIKADMGKCHEVIR